MKYLWPLGVLMPISGYAANSIETIIVTAKNQNAAIATQQLRASEQLPGPGVDAAELLRGLAGVQVDSRSNYAQDTRITLRGFGARSAFGVRGIDLMIDGIPLTMPDGQGQFSGALLDNVRQISVLTGPVAALYGNAAGGVIALQSEKPSQNNLTLEQNSGANQLSRQQLTGEWRQGEFGLRAQGSHTETDGNRPHASARREQAGIQAYFSVFNTVQAQWRLDYEDAPLLEDPLGLTESQWRNNPQQLNSSAELFNTHKTLHHLQNALSLKQEDQNQRWQFSLWQGEREIEQYLAQKGDAIANSGGIVNLARDFYGTNGNYTWDLPASQPLSFTLGAEYSAMEDRRRGYVNNNGGQGPLRRDELGTVANFDQYIIAQWQTTADWQWLVGLRKSRIRFDIDDYFVVPGNGNDSGEREFNFVSQAISTAYHFTPLWELNLSTGKGFETPTLTETAYSNADTGFNRNLNPAQNQQSQITLNFEDKKFNSGLTLFAINSENEIVVNQSSNGRTSYRNAANTERRGAELETRWEISAYLNSRAAVNFLNAEYSEGQWRGNNLPGVAKTNHFLQLNWRPFGNQKLEGSLALAFRSAVATQDDNIIKAPASTTADLAIKGEWDVSPEWTSQWWFKVANLTDEQYVGSVIVNQNNGRSFEPAEGRNLGGGISIMF